MQMINIKKTLLITVNGIRQFVKYVRKGSTPLLAALFCHKLSNTIRTVPMYITQVLLGAPQETLSIFRRCALANTVSLGEIDDYYNRIHASFCSENAQGTLTFPHVEHTD